MSKEKIEFFLEDISYRTTYSFLECGKDDDELQEIAKKYKISVPSKDIAIFKGKYAFVDKQNKNGCTLPKEEVEKALTTLNGKPVDKDHLRKSTLGYWFGADLSKNSIVSYGAFWKSNFPEDYEDIKNRMSEGKMKISFEAWGDREFNENGGYNLTNIEFAGGALLFDTEPAFEDAEVLEFARVMTTEEKNKLFYKGDLEESRLNFNWDSETIARMMCETECPSCKIVGWHDILNIDFVQSKIKSSCPNCSGINEWSLTPSVKVIKKGKRIEATQANIDVSERHEKGGDKEVDELLKKYNVSKVEDLMKLIDENVASLAVKEQEIATLKTSLEDLKKVVETAQSEAKTAKESLEAKITAEKAALVTARKAELTDEYSKEMTDEDILDNVKFENAKLRKELAMIKAGKPAQGGLEAGAIDGAVSATNEVFKIQKNIQAQAFAGEE